MSYEDEIIKKYNSILYGARVEITGRSIDGTRETITFTTPPRADGERVKTSTSMPGMRWERIKISPALYLMRGVSQDGETTDTYLCPMGCSKKIPIGYRDLNYPQFLKLKRTLKQWDRDPHEKIFKII